MTFLWNLGFALCADFTFLRNDAMPKKILASDKGKKSEVTGL
jgi:hypothetical protein